LEVETLHPLLLGELLEEATGGAAGAGDEDVDPAELVERGPHAPVHVGGDAHVARLGDDPAPGLLAELVRRRLQGLRRAGGDHHVAALVAEAPSHFPPDALAGAGDERDLAGEIQVHDVSFGPRGVRMSADGSGKRARVYQISAGRARQPLPGGLMKYGIPSTISDAPDIRSSHG